MRELSDLEICKRIAEIEGVYVFEYEHIVHGNVICYDPIVNGLAPQQYNPLTDDALCFKLMVKYSIDLTHELEGDEYKHHRYVAQRLLAGKVYPVVKTHKQSPNKAICLAIIEANKELTNEN